MAPEFAYVTLLAGAGDYVKGAVGLAKGLRQVGSIYPLVVAVFPDVPVSHRQLLESQGCTIKPIEPVQFPQESQAQFVRSDFGINYSKLRIWEFVEYKKMIYLDADTQVFGNIDHLFDDLPGGHLYAVLDCYCEWYHSEEYRIGYCQQCPERVAWPTAEMGPLRDPYFNAGMLVFEPSAAVYERLLDAVRTNPPTAFAEQDLLNMFFRDIYKPIPPIYNFLAPMLWRHPEKVELEKVKVVHFCATGSKPWRYTGKEANMGREDMKMLVKMWWDVYNGGEIKDYTKVPAELTTLPLKAALKAGTGHSGIKAPSAA